MDHLAHSAPSTMSLEAARRLDRRCADFEAQWRAGKRPVLEPYLVEVPDEERAALLLELLLLELEYRRRVGEVPSSAEYYSRFTDLRSAIDAAFERTATMPTPALRPEVTETIGEARYDATPSNKALPRRFGQYELMREIARGGMGIVFEARRAASDRPLALKMVLSGALASRVEVARFRREAEAAAQLDHPHIVPIYETGECEGHVFFTMALVQGESLSDRLKRGPMSAREAAYFVLQIAEAVQYAHARGIVHRDLKPGNVLIDRGGNVQVTDFGLAKRLESPFASVDEPPGDSRPVAEKPGFAAPIGPADLTRTGTVLGTPAYMAPEQATGAKHVGPSADIYSLGVILYALLTGRPPFLAATLGELVDQLLHRRPVPPSEINRQVDRTLEAICLRCLEKEPAQRYTSASDLAEHLRRYTSGLKVQLPGSGWIARTERYLDDHPGLVPVTTALVVRPWLGWSEAIFTGAVLGGMALNIRLRMPKRPIVGLGASALAAVLLIVYSKWSLTLWEGPALSWSSLKTSSFGLAIACSAMLMAALAIGWATLGSSQHWYRWLSVIGLLAVLLLPPFAAWRLWLTGAGYGSPTAQSVIDWTVIVTQLVLCNVLPFVLGFSLGIVLNHAAQRMFARGSNLNARQLFSFQLGGTAVALILALALPYAMLGMDVPELRAPGVGPLMMFGGVVAQQVDHQLQLPELFPVAIVASATIIAGPMFQLGVAMLALSRFVSRLGAR